MVKLLSLTREQVRRAVSSGWAKGARLILEEHAPSRSGTAPAAAAAAAAAAASMTMGLSIKLSNHQSESPSPRRLGIIDSMIR